MPQRLRRIGASLTLATLGLWAASLAAAEAPPRPPKAKRYSDPRNLEVSPKPAPTPALKYRLLPLESQRTPGDAAPVYIRLGAKATTEAKNEIGKKWTDWSNLPLDRLPVAEVRTFLAPWSPTLQQLDFAARRESCRWNYTLAEQKEQVIEVTMPDAQDMRTWARLLSLKARLELAENRLDEALRTIETGISSGRHAGDGPFLINSLLGAACCHVMLSDVEEWIARPEAPDLYWALTALPRPLVSARAAMETEEVMPEWVLPELTEVDRPHSDAEWAMLLGRLHARWKELEVKFFVNGQPAKPKLAGLATFRTETLPAARAYVKERRGSTEGLSDDRVILQYLAGSYRDIYDTAFKSYYLPYSEAFAVAAEAEKRLQAYKDGPLEYFTALMPHVAAVHRAEAQLDRRVAALRVIEALRMHAAESKQWPTSLDRVTIVPVPLDPMTGKPFEYRLDGETAVLIGPETTLQLVLTYRLTLRK